MFVLSLQDVPVPRQSSLPAALHATSAGNVVLASSRLASDGPSVAGHTNVTRRALPDARTTWFVSFDRFAVKSETHGPS